jgi:ABC-2 type transport system permease protein
MFRNIFTKTLRDNRTAFIGWSIGILGFLAIIVSFYPSVRNLPSLDELFKGSNFKVAKGFVGGSTDFSSPSGYLQSELYGLYLPMLLLIFSLLQVRALINGEEKDGTLAVLLSTGVSRTQVVLQKFAAYAVQLFALFAVIWIFLALTMPIVGLNIGLMAFTASLVRMAIIIGMFGALALALGCISPGIGLAPVIVVALASYLLNALAPLSTQFAGWQKLSPFYYMSTGALSGGFHPLQLLIFGSITVALVIIAVASFNKRDISN